MVCDTYPQQQQQSMIFTEIRQGPAVRIHLGFSSCGTVDGIGLLGIVPGKLRQSHRYRQGSLLNCLTSYGLSRSAWEKEVNLFGAKFHADSGIFFTSSGCVVCLEPRRDFCVCPRSPPTTHSAAASPRCLRHGVFAIVYWSACFVQFSCWDCGCRRSVLVLKRSHMEF